MTPETAELPLPYPNEVHLVFGFKQSSWPRSWCLKAVPHSWWMFLSVVMVLLYSVALSMYNPCNAERDFFLVCLDHCFFGFFLIETIMNVLAHGVSGHKESYLQNNWNRFDAFIIAVELLGYALRIVSIDLSGLLDSLRPLRLIRRITGLRRNVEILIGTLPMFVSVILLFNLLIIIFSIVGVQVWKGQLRNRCFLEADGIKYNTTMYPFYSLPKNPPFICSPYDKDGQHCSDVPSTVKNNTLCPVSPQSPALPSFNVSDSCFDWNSFYRVCRRGDENPYKGAINFDNIGYAWIAIFQVITLEGWSEIMYFVMDASSFWSFLYFIVVTVIGAFIMMNVCAVVIATQFSKCAENKKKEEQGEKTQVPLKEEAKRFLNRVYVLLSSFFRCPKVTPSYHKEKEIQQTVYSYFREFVKKCVSTDSFDRVILFVVCLSLVAIAVEHHQQPLLLTKILHISNIFINAIFFVEMVLKLLAYSFDYFRKLNTLVDFIIVVASCVELLTTGDGRLAVLRVFRLLRLVRLIKFLPYLRRQARVLIKTITEAITLCFMLLLFIFVFSLLGMHCFGCKFNFAGEEHKRKHFDSILPSMITVFQILTQEDWNYVLYDGMAATNAWASLYFVAVIMLGKHLLLNILVSIVVHNFQVQGAKARQGRILTHSVQHDAHPSHLLCQADTMVSHRATENTPAEAALDEQQPWYLRFIPQWCIDRKEWSLFLFSPQNRFRDVCNRITSSVTFDRLILVFVALSCITLAMERPSISPGSTERLVLTFCEYAFAILFTLEMILKIVAWGLVIGKDSYCHSPWNFIDGLLVILSVADVLVLLTHTHHNHDQKILGLLKVLRLLRTLRPLRVLKHTPRLKLAVHALLASVKPIANIILISGVFFFFYGILGVQFFKGAFYNCVDEEFSDIRNMWNITNKTECLRLNYSWQRRTYNFDSILQALVSLFVMYSKDGWVNLMYDGLDAVGEDLQPVTNYRPWMALYFISFMVMSFFLLDMFIGIMVDTFHNVQQKQNVQQEKHTLGPEVTSTMESTRYSRLRRMIHILCRSFILDLLMLVVIIFNVLIMTLEHDNQTPDMENLIDYTFYGFTAIFIIEIGLKPVAFGGRTFIKNNWNRLDLLVLVVSIISIVLTALHLDDKLPINPSILRTCRVLSLPHVLKTKKTQVLIQTIMKTLSQVGNLCLLFAFFLFIYAVLTVELFGKLECTPEYPCAGLSRYSHFNNFGSALLTLYKVGTGDNWSGIFMDTLRECRPDDDNCVTYLYWASPLCFCTFVIMVQFVLVNLIVAAIMQAQEESAAGVDDSHSLAPDPPELEQEPTLESV